MADVNRGKRPLSPHLTIYRPQLTSMTSILTRITGNAILLAALLIVWWFLAAAISPEAFALAGLRHLIWDNAVGLDIPTAEKLGWACLIGSVLLTLVTLAII